MGKRKERVARKLTVADAVSIAHGEFVSLGEELREWADNIQEKFGSTSKYETLDNSASELENLNEPTVPESVAGIEFEHFDPPPKRRGYSRPSRRDHMINLLDSAIGAIETAKEQLDPDKDSEAVGEMDEIIDEIENLKGEAENVEFPGMYG